MNFSNEKELQYYIAAVMTSKGVKVDLEVATHNGRRIDLVTSRYAIECKPTLTRAALLQAAAQMKLYARSFPNHEYVLAGMSPQNTKGYKAAHSAAVDIREEFGDTVWFIDRMSYFTDIEDKEDDEANCKDETHNTSHRIDDIYGIKRTRTDIKLTVNTDLKRKKSEAKAKPQAKGRETTKSSNYKRIVLQTLRYGFVIYLSCAVIEGIYNRIKNNDRNYWGTALGVGLVYITVYPFDAYKEKES